MSTTLANDLRLIESGFPCHQIGAETQRERGASSALPPLYYLHVWWARRPLTPSRAAILGATLPAGADISVFLQLLGIRRRIALVRGVRWVISPKDSALLDRLSADGSRLRVDDLVLRRLEAENERRRKSLQIINDIKRDHPDRMSDPVLQRWQDEDSQSLNHTLLLDTDIPVVFEAADPALSRERIDLEDALGVRTDFDKYGYDRAYTQSQRVSDAKPLTVLDPTSGGGSIPFEALRLGHNVIANELNPVATVIQFATLDYPRRYGSSLSADISRWGDAMLQKMQAAIGHLFPASHIPDTEASLLREHLSRHLHLVPEYSKEIPDGYLYCRQVTCPHCGGQAPLLNALWLSKEDGDKWAVRLHVRSKARVEIEPYRLVGATSRELAAELDAGTVTDGQAVCVHCRQVIDGNEIKAQGRGDSEHGVMSDRLYCIVGVRVQPKLKKNGDIDRYTSGERAGEAKTQKIRYFRAAAEMDFNAIADAERMLRDQWTRFERLDLIPVEAVPAGHKTGDEGGAGSGTDKPLKLGTDQWHKMFTPRQLLGHLFIMEALRDLKPQILSELGTDRGRAVLTYLQFAIDKGLDYNSRQTRWIYQRGQVSGTFGRHDFSFKWTFGEMVFASPRMGAAWGLSQILDSYSGLVELLADVPSQSRVTIINGSGAQMAAVADNSVDLIVNDPPYYNNVMYAELSDFFYVWQKRSLADLYPGLFDAYLTDKQSEAVANPHRDGSAESAKHKYEQLMREMYAECRRVTKPDGRMVLMFTHKSQEGWETLTQALIDSGWTITATYPVESEFGNSMHIMENASAESTIFLVCKKRDGSSSEPGLWKAFGGQGVQQRIVDEVRTGLGEFEALKLRPVDTMIASYGRALRVLSEKWPVLDGDEPVSPIRALNEASRVVAQHHIQKLTQGRLKVEDLTPEAAMTVTLYGICGLQPIRYDEVLNIARSLGISIDSRTAGYDAAGKTIGYATETTGRRASRSDDIVGYHAPLVRKGSNLRIALPEERNAKRLASPQHEWDILQGLILKFREGDVPVARAYLTEHAEGSQGKIIDLLRVWGNEADDEKLRKEAEMMLFGLAR